MTSVSPDTSRVRCTYQCFTIAQLWVQQADGSWLELEMSDPVLERYARNRARFS